jgi:radical SAM superfamily enzyme YgiQ (UPF0313 family)
MARISIISIFDGMRFAPAQLMAELLRDGHEPQIIFFKKQERVALERLKDPEVAKAFSYCDCPSISYELKDGDCCALEWGVYKKTKAHELRHLRTCLEDFKPDAIGLSSLSMGMGLGEEVITFLRQHFSQPILWGGVGPTVEPDRAIQSADLVCVGEGEEVIREIAARLDQKQSIEDIPGTWFKRADGEIIKNPKRAPTDLDSIAIPVYDPARCVQIKGPHFIYAPEDVITYKNRGNYMIMTQRGCPFSCSFCVESYYQDEFGKKGSLKRRSPQLVLDELKIAKEQGYKGISFFDDVFTINRRWLQEFLPRYKKEIGLPFWCYTYPTTHNPEILKMLVEAGCNAITMGIQSGSERILIDVYGRNTKTKRVLESVRELEQAGFNKVSFDLIPRTQFDTEEDLQLTLELLRQIPKSLHIVSLSSLTSFPNYSINDRSQDKELLARAEHLSEDTYHYYFKLFHITRSPQVSDEQLQQLIDDPAYRKDHRLLNPFLPESRIDLCHSEPDIEAPDLATALA